MLIGDNNLFKINNGLAMKHANFMLFLLAYTLGRTSPKSKIKKVTKSTSTKNFTAGMAIVENNLSNEKEKRITTAMCRKLFATKIVANSFFGFAKSWLIIECLEGFCCDKSDKSFWDKENSATSAAATIAVQKSKQQIPKIPINKLESKLNKVKLGSGSKLNEIGYY